MPVLAAALAAPAARFVVADIDWAQFPAAAPVPFFARLAGEAQPAAMPAGAGGELRERLATVAPAEARALLHEALGTHAAVVLGHAPGAAIDDNAPLWDLGLSSFTALELTNRLRAETGLNLATGTVFDHPTLNSLVDHVHGLLTSQPT
jgi:aryl carrier-like protein